MANFVGQKQGKTASGKRQGGATVKRQRENFVAHGKLCRGQAARKTSVAARENSGQWQGKHSTTANGKLPLSTANGKFVVAG